MKISKFMYIIRIVFLILMIVNAAALWQLNKGIVAEREAALHQMEFYKLGNDLIDASDYLTGQAQRYALFGEKLYYDNYWREVNETHTRDKVIERLKELGAPKAELDLLEIAKKNSDILIVTEEEAMRAVGEGDFDKARNLIFGKTYENRKEDIMHLTEEFLEKMNTRTAKEAKITALKAKQLFNITYTLIGLLVIMIIFTFVILDKKVKNLGLITKRLDELASSEGDLTLRVAILGKDEVGNIAESFNTFTAKIQTIIQEIAGISKQVSSSSRKLTSISEQSAVATDEIARTIEEIAVGANDQAMDIEKGANHIAKLGDEIEKNQQDVDNLNYAVNKINALKEEGMEIVKELVEKTQGVNEVTEEIHKNIIDTTRSAEKVENVSGMIKDLSEQTNLLALNAAIEAARVGETGKGFAVVAEEIRKLAEQSHYSTEEIDVLIQDMIIKTKDTFDTMQEVRQIVTFQARSVEMTNTKFEGIAQSIEEVKIAIASLDQSKQEMENKKNNIIDIIQNLSAISEENATGAEEVSASVEEQTASAEEISYASEILAKLAEEMKNSIGRFKH